MPTELTQVTNLETSADPATQLKMEDGPGMDRWAEEMESLEATPSVAKQPEDGKRDGSEGGHVPREAEGGDDAVGKDKAAPKQPTTSDENKTQDKVSKQSETPKQTTLEVPKTKASDTQRIPASRNYEGLTDAEVSVFKKMSNDAYNAMRPIFDEHKKLKESLTLKDQEIANLKSGKEQLPSDFYSHSDAYTLTKDYRDGVQLVNGAQSIYNHWRTQLAKVEAGEDWQDLEIDETGKMKLGATKAVDPTAKAEILDNLTFAREQYLKHYNNLNSIKTEFTQKHAKVKDFVSREIEDAYFPFYKTDELNKPHMADHKKAIEAVMKALPDEIRGELSAPVAAKAFAYTLYMQREMNELKQKLALYETKASDKSKAQPTRVDTVATTTKPAAPDLSDFESAMD